MEASLGAPHLPVNVHNKCSMGYDNERQSTTLL